MRFLTHALAVLTAISLLATSPYAFAKDKSKAKSAKKVTRVTKRNNHMLPMLTFKQVAQLPMRQRVDYVRTFRKAVIEAEKMQKVFDDAFASTDDTNSKDKYAVLEETMRWLLGPLADAQSGAMECIHSGNISSYPGVGRVPFRCREVNCDYNPEIKNSGTLCNFSAFGTVHATNVGCIKVTVKAKSTEECWEHREDLIRHHRSENDQLLAQVDEYFGFGPNGEFNYEQGFDSETAKNLISKMMVNAYDDRVYAQLIKTSYFYVNSGKCFGQDLPIYKHMEELSGAERRQFEHAQSQLNAMLETANGPCGSNQAIEKDFNKLSEVAARIFKRHKDHCATPLTSDVVEDIRTGANLYSKSNPSGTAWKGSVAYQLEVDRQRALENLSPGETPTHENVLEVPECRRLNLLFTDLKRRLETNAGTFPHAKNTTPPPHIDVNPWSPDDRYTKIEPTGCTENVTADELSQESARCMACIIQGHEAKRQGEDLNSPSYVPSRKYISLIGTMALACGDGRVNDTTVIPEAMVDYWKAFGHCSEDTYTWTDEDFDNAKFLKDWSLKNNTWRSTGDPDKDKDKFNPKKNPNHPDHDKKFAKLYGLSFDTATKIFCPKDRYKKTFWTRRINGYNPKDWERDRQEVFNMQREAFLQFKKVVNDDPQVDTPANALMACLKEAEGKIKDLRITEPPKQMDNRMAGEGGATSCLSENFLKDPPVMFARAECFIPKQRETMKTMPDGKTPCLDKDRDNKHDKTGAECSSKSRVALLWVKASGNRIPDSTSADGFKRYSLAPGSGDSPGDGPFIWNDKMPSNEGRTIMQTSCLGSSPQSKGQGNWKPSTK